MPIWIIVIFGVRGVASFVTDYGMAYIARNVVQKIRTEVFDTYLRMTSAFFANEPSGHQVARITYTSEQVAAASTDAVKVAVIDGLSVIGYAAVMIYQQSVPRARTVLAGARRGPRGDRGQPSLPQDQSPYPVDDGFGERHGRGNDRRPA